MALLVTVHILLTRPFISSLAASHTQGATASICNLLCGLKLQTVFLLALVMLDPTLALKAAFFFLLLVFFRGTLRMHMIYKTARRPHYYYYLFVCQEYNSCGEQEKHRIRQSPSSKVSWNKVTDSFKDCLFLFSDVSPKCFKNLCFEFCSFIGFTSPYSSSHHIRTHHQQQQHY